MSLARCTHTVACKLVYLEAKDCEYDHPGVGGDHNEKTFEIGMMPASSYLTEPAAAIDPGGIESDHLSSRVIV